MNEGNKINDATTNTPSIIDGLKETNIFIRGKHSINSNPKVIK
jgi:hypothetical protein